MKKLWQKIKQIKHWEIYLAVLALVLIVGIYFSTLKPKQNKTAVETSTTVPVTAPQTYADALAQKLETVIGQIAGAGKVAVLVMTDGEGTAELAYNTQEKTVTQTGLSGQEITTTTKEQQLLTNTNGQPVVLWQNPPALVGIVVVATGADQVAVRLQIMRAVQTIIGDQQVALEILPGR